MVFSSLLFVFVFLAACYGIYALMPGDPIAQCGAADKNGMTEAPEACAP